MEKLFEVRDMRHKEKFQVDDLYLNGYAKKVGVYGTAVYMSLCRHSNKQQESHPSIKKIAEQHNCSEKQIGRAIKSLEDLNVIKKVRLGKKLNNRYLLLDKSEWTNSPISDKTGSPITTDSQSDHLRTDSPIHSKDTHFKDTHRKDRENKFSPPSFDDVKGYCDERKNGVNPQKFIDFYESKGWFIGKNKMKSWQAAVRTWEGRDYGGRAEEEVKIPAYFKSKTI